MLRAIIQILKIATVLTLAILTLFGGQRFFDYAVDRSTAADVGRRVAFSVSEDDTTDSVADRLHTAGLIRSTVVFATQLRLSGGAFVPGDYTLRKGMTVADIIDRITGSQAADTGDDTEAAQFDITIPEGWRTEQIAEEAEKDGLQGGYDALLKATETINPDNYNFLADRPAGASLEGFLFPDTYTFVSNDPEYNLQLMLDDFDAKFTPEMRKRADEMGLTIFQVVTLASIVEREAVVPEERPTIAGVYFNRIDAGWNLDADPTMQYAVGKRGDWWPKLGGSDLDALDPANGYNTYKNPGLPVGPIANPGLASIQAVLSPEEHDYMFFVGKDDGSETHAFAVTKEEQDANVCQYLKQCDG